MKKMEKYIKTRIEQLKEDMNKAHNEHDRMWYNRCIQELDWKQGYRCKVNQHMIVI